MEYGKKPISGGVNNGVEKHSTIIRERVFDYEFVPEVIRAARGSGGGRMRKAEDGMMDIVVSFL